MPNLYHGTGTIFERFDLDKLKTGEGVNKYLPAFYLTSSLDLASCYADDEKNRFAFDKDGIIYDDKKVGGKDVRHFRGIVLDVLVSRDDNILDGDEMPDYDAVKYLLIDFINKSGEFDKIDGMIGELFDLDGIHGYIDHDEWIDIFQKMVLIDTATAKEIFKEFLEDKIGSISEDLESDEIYFDESKFTSIAKSIYDECVGLKRQCGVFDGRDMSGDQTWLSVIETFFKKELDLGGKAFCKAMKDAGIDAVYLSEISTSTTHDVSGDCYMYFNPYNLNIKNIVEPTLGEFAPNKEKGRTFDSNLSM